MNRFTLKVILAALIVTFAGVAVASQAKAGDLKNSYNAQVPFVPTEPPSWRQPKPDNEVYDVIIFKSHRHYYHKPKFHAGKRPHGHHKSRKPAKRFHSAHVHRKNKRHHPGLLIRLGIQLR